MFVASFVYLAARSGADAIGYPLGYGAASFLGALWGGLVACLLSVSLGLYFQAFVLAAPAAASDAAAAAAAVGSGPAAAHRRIANSSVEALRLPHNSPLPASPDIFAGQDITAMPGKGGGGGGGGSNHADTAATAAPTGLGGLLLSLGRRFGQCRECLCGCGARALRGGENRGWPRNGYARQQLWRLPAGEHCEPQCRRLRTTSRTVGTAGACARPPCGAFSE